MPQHIRLLSAAIMAASAVLYLSGCSGNANKGGTGQQAPNVSGEAEQHEHATDDHHAREGHTEAAGGHAHPAGGHGGNEAEMKARVDKLASYQEALKHIAARREQIEHLIEHDKLADVHPPAQEISLTARRLPELASKSDIPKEQWKEINTQSRDLANLFNEIDTAADGGKKPETEAAFAKMVGLIESLQAFASSGNSTPNQ